MVRIAWNALGFYLAEALPKGRHFNAEYYRDNILTELIRLRPQAGERNLVIHADNAAITLLNTVALFVPKMGFGILKDQFRFPDSWMSGDWMCATMFQTLQRYSDLHFIDHHLNQPNHSVKRSKIIFKKSPSDFP
jgi:hypothetical protein